MQQQGLAREEFMGRPVIGIINTWSERSPSQADLCERAEPVSAAGLDLWGAQRFLGAEERKYRGIVPGMKLED